MTDSRALIYTELKDSNTKERREVQLLTSFLIKKFGILEPLFPLRELL